MTTPRQVVERVYELFQAGWGATTAFTFENEQFSPPKNAAWVRVTVGSDVGGQSTLGRVGNRRYRRLASVFIEVFTPIDAGVALSRDLIQQARDLFEGQPDPEIDFFDGNWRRRPDDPTGYYSSLLEIEFAFFEIK